MDIQEMKKLVGDLSWHKPKKIQENAMKRLQNIDDFQTMLFIDETQKSCWENAVKVLQIIGYPRNRFAIPSLIWLLKDLTWPGVDSGIEIMKGIDHRVLLPSIEQALIDANKEKDSLWIAGIKRLLYILEISKEDLKKEEVYKILDLADF